MKNKKDKSKISFLDLFGSIRIPIGKPTKFHKKKSKKDKILDIRRKEMLHD